ncbi:hypothetical protein ACTXT7_001480 [Hymenolepis weldensis]
MPNMKDDPLCVSKITSILLYENTSAFVHEAAVTSLCSYDTKPHLSCLNASIDFLLSITVSFHQNHTPLMSSRASLSDSNSIHQNI